MHQYDLNIFSPNEFEEFSRDILQARLNTYIESFKTGRDGGIDLRFTNAKKLKAIIQAKRYKNFSSLIDNLKKEVFKVEKLYPDQYIITTSVGLSPQNKETIKSLFTPFIKSTEDIYGKEDLLNILSQNKKIEEKYYKLWITSTTILEKVLHSRIYNQSQFELEEINNQIKLYVQNPSFDEAINILNTHRYIIISGIPGIGKTTLSRILTFYLLSNGYEEFIYLSDKIDDGYTYFKEDKKQIFLFDDFLGKNFFDAKDLQKNDDKIIKFINKIKNSPDKVLFLVTREYILNQAKEVYEAFKINNIEIAKCIIDLSSYTKIIKAKILYNHLYYGQIPEAYINNLLENENYNLLISHRNYSPRIIETFMKQKIWNNCKPVDFYKVIKTLFDNPESVWLFSFENSLDKFSQYVLLILSTLGTPVLLTDLELAVQMFFQKNNYKLLINYDSIKFLKSIRELENTFIKTNRDKNGKISVEYQNPSVYDFLINYLHDKNIIILSDLIDSFVFIDQFYKIFSGNKIYGKIQLVEQLIERLALRLLELESSLVSKC
ncbi:MAG TPA: restriction endonuclease [Hanamia sp.]|nr:restriction endonuclease [Hanamia sp.]